MTNSAPNSGNDVEASLDATRTQRYEEARFDAGSGSLGAARPEWCRTADRKGRQPQET